MEISEDVGRDLFNRLEPVSNFGRGAEYHKILKRMRNGNMTSYIYKGTLMYDPQEVVDHRLRSGRRPKDTILKPKIVIKNIIN